jgi:signal transduction histidine kinase
MARLQSVMLQSAATISDREHARDILLHSQKMAALGELASGITHDFRNILQTVISSLELLESRSDDPEQVRRLVVSALRASQRGIGLSERLLRFARREVTATTPISLLWSLESATETLARTVEARMNVGIEPPPPDLWPVAVDPMEFELALINLGLNARDAMPHGGRIRFSARNVTIPSVDRRDPRERGNCVQINRRGSRLALSVGDYVAVSVGDTGTGMDEATLARAVDRFFTTKPVGKGTGLGLAAVHDLATQVHGALRLRSEVGKGTIVELWLPRASAVISASLGQLRQRARPSRRASVALRP